MSPKCTKEISENGIIKKDLAIVQLKFVYSLLFHCLYLGFSDMLG